VLDKTAAEGASINWNSIDYVDIRVTQKAGNSSDFGIWVDYLENYEAKWRKLDIPHFSIESCQTQIRGGREAFRYEYTLLLKRVRPPPY